MKLHRISEGVESHREFTHSFTKVPLYALNGYFNIDELISLTHTHKFFAKLCCVVAVDLSIFSRYSRYLNYIKISKQFPKVRFVIEECYNTIPWPPLFSKHITSLDLSNHADPRSIAPLSNLTSLRLDGHSRSIKTEILANLTKLVCLSLRYNNKISGSILRRLSSLRILNLDSNAVITADDIKTMKLEYLSMVNNSTLTPDFKRMTLTRLNIDRGLLVRLGDELIHCTTIKHLDIREIRDGYYKSHSEKLIWPKKLTFLEELTLDLVPETNFGDYLNKLTFLEYKNSLETHCDSNPRCPSTLRTLIIKGKMPCFSDYYPVSLTHLEISDIYGQGFQWDGKSSYCDLINLTHLQLSNTPFDYLGGLDNLKTLILYTITMPKRPIDIYGLKSLKSLKISGGNFYYFENRGGLQRSESLESLTIDTHNSPMNDDLLLTFPGVKYIYLGSISCKDVTGSCFKDLPNLFFLEIPKDENNLDKGCLESLRARDIIIRYIPKAYDFNYPNT